MTNVATENRQSLITRKCVQFAGKTVFRFIKRLYNRIMCRHLYGKGPTEVISRDISDHIIHSFSEKPLVSLVDSSFFVAYESDLMKGLGRNNK